MPRTQHQPSKSFVVKLWKGLGRFARAFDDIIVDKKFNANKSQNRNTSQAKFFHTLLSMGALVALGAGAFMILSSALIPPLGIGLAALGGTMGLFAAFGKPFSGNRYQGLTTFVMAALLLVTMPVAALMDVGRGLKNLVSAIKKCSNRNNTAPTATTRYLTNTARRPHGGPTYSRLPAAANDALSASPQASGDNVLPSAPTQSDSDDDEPPPTYEEVKNQDAAALKQHRRCWALSPSSNA
ncbi:MAG: hypothetical protein DHS20C10_08510 [marine bacterium B5-7]|nr:MAG: hypothetical protein DHS20C10_08510 [marine bacterium B5-7]